MTPSNGCKIRLANLHQVPVPTTAATAQTTTATMEMITATTEARLRLKVSRRVSSKARTPSSKARTPSSKARMPSRRASSKTRRASSKTREPPSRDNRVRIRMPVPLVSGAASSSLKCDPRRGSHFRFFLSGQRCLTVGLRQTSDFSSFSLVLIATVL